MVPAAGSLFVAETYFVTVPDVLEGQAEYSSELDCKAVGMLA